MLVFTSISKNYLPKARVLAKSIKRFQPNWIFVLMLCDSIPEDFDLEGEPFDELLLIENLEILNWKSWVFGHKLVELCTAVKGPAAEILSRRLDIDKIMYLDPDIKVFSSLNSLEILLDQYDILLTPHLIDIETNIDAIKDNEISALKHGIYNLGFFAARTSGQGLEFIKWFSSRLRTFCRDDIPNGLFTDQRWCDLVPAYFSGLHIIRDRGCNVATWNISHRPLTKNESGEYLAAGVPLRFYHFSSYDSGSGFEMLRKYASQQAIAIEIWRQYDSDLIFEGQGENKYKNWRYENFDNGEKIPKLARCLYRESNYLQSKFPDPFSIDEPNFLNWWKKEDKSISDFRSSQKILLLKSVFYLIYKIISSPNTATQILKSIYRTLKYEGFLKLISKIRNY